MTRFRAMLRGDIILSLHLLRHGYSLGALLPLGLPQKVSSHVTVILWNVILDF